MTEDVTVGELFRALGELKESVTSGFGQVFQRVENLRAEFVSKDLYASELAALRRQVEDMSDSRRWFITTAISVVAAVGAIAAVVTALVFH